MLGENRTHGQGVLEEALSGSNRILFEVLAIQPEDDLSLEAFAYLTTSHTKGITFPSRYLQRVPGLAE